MPENLSSVKLDGRLPVIVIQQRGFYHGRGFNRDYYAGGWWGPGYDDYWDYPDYAYGGYDDGGCYVVQRRIRTRYGWRIRPVQVCG